MKFFEKVYDGNSFIDIEQDIMESFNPMYNPVAAEILTDENEMPRGSFKVIVEWQEVE